MEHKLPPKCIAPSLLSADFSRLGEELKAVENAGAQILHLDVMDGHFVPNLTFGPPLIASLRKRTEMTLDVHLMITNAEDTWQAYADAGADMISVHAEAVTHLDRLVHAVRERGISAGAVLNPATPLSLLDEILPSLDFVLLMSVNPGFGGQSFIPGSRDKIRRLRSMIREKNCGHVKIEVDGGVGLDNIADLLHDGADILVAGSAVFRSGNIQETIKKMNGIIENHG